MISVHFCLRYEAAVSDEVGCQQRHTTLTRKLYKARVNVFVREPLHQLVVPHRMRRDMDRFSDTRGCHAGFFDASDGFHAAIVSPRYAKRNGL